MTWPFFCTAPWWRINKLHPLCCSAATRPAGGAADCPAAMDNGDAKMRVDERAAILTLYTLTGRVRACVDSCGLCAVIKLTPCTAED